MGVSGLSCAGVQIGQFLFCLEIRAGVVFPAEEGRFLVATHNFFCAFGTKPPVSAA